MIFAAGQGTRLAPLTDHTPKPLLPVQGKPLLDWQLGALAQAGVTDVVINLHHLGEQIADYVGDGSRWRLNVRFVWETELLETGGGLINALPHLGTAPFWVLNGDIWTDFDFRILPSEPPAGALAHFVLTPTPQWRTDGDFEIDGQWVSMRGSNYCYCGIGVWSVEALHNQPKGRYSLRDIFFKLVETRQMSCQIHHGEWHDIGTLEHYQTLT